MFFFSNVLLGMSRSVIEVPITCLRTKQFIWFSGNEKGWTKKKKEMREKKKLENRGMIPRPEQNDRLHTWEELLSFSLFSLSRGKKKGKQIREKRDKNKKKKKHWITPLSKKQNETEHTHKKKLLLYTHILSLSLSYIYKVPHVCDTDHTKMGE